MYSTPKFTALLASSMLVTVAGCASAPPPPTANLQAAQQAIANAERVEAGRYAAGELGEARTKLASADTAVTDKKMDLAAQYADESRADAELAAAKPSLSKAHTVNADINHCSVTLLDVLESNTKEQKRTKNNPTLSVCPSSLLPWPRRSSP